MSLSPPKDLLPLYTLYLQAWIKAWTGHPFDETDFVRHDPNAVFDAIVMLQSIEDAKKPPLKRMSPTEFAEWFTRANIADSLRSLS